MDSLMGNSESLRLGAARLRRDADLVATMGYRVTAASDRVIFTGPAADRLRSDALDWRQTTNSVASQLLSVAELLDRAAVELETPGSGSAVGLAAWGGPAIVQSTIGTADITQYGGPVSSAGSGDVFDVGGIPATSDPISSVDQYGFPTGGYAGAGDVVIIGGSGLPTVTTDPVGNAGSGAGNVVIIGGSGLPTVTTDPVGNAGGTGGGLTTLNFPTVYIPATVPGGGGTATIGNPTYNVDLPTIPINTGSIGSITTTPGVLMFDTLGQFASFNNVGDIGVIVDSNPIITYPS